MFKDVAIKKLLLLMIFISLSVISMGGIYILRGNIVTGNQQIILRLRLILP